MVQPYRLIDSVLNRFLCGDTLALLKRFPSESVDCVVTSPPYWAMRDYGVEGQIGLESDFEDYLTKLDAIFNEVRRILKPEGTCWVNLGDTYSSPLKGSGNGKPRINLVDKITNRAAFHTLRTQTALPPKALCLIPSRFAIRMLESGWILRNEIIWHKPNVTPQSMSDRFTMDFEKIFFFVKSRKYYFSQQFESLRRPDRLSKPLRNPDNIHKYENNDSFFSVINPKTYENSRKRILSRGRNMRAVWTVATRAYRGKHFASFPPQIIETPIKAGCPEEGIVLDPFMGSGTTALVAKQLGRNFVGIELNPEYIELAKQRLKAKDRDTHLTGK